MSDTLNKISAAINEHVVENVRKNWGESGAALSLRIPTALDNLLDEMSMTLDRPKAEIVLWFVEAGARALEKEVQEALNETSGIIFSNSHTPSRAFMLNSNYNNCKSDHFEMLRNQEAAAFCDSHKHVIEKLREGDRVYLYQSTHGIVAVGTVKGGIIKSARGNDPEGRYAVKLSDFKEGFPAVSAKLFKKITGGGANFRMVLTELSEEQNEMLWKYISGK